MAVEKLQGIVKLTSTNNSFQEKLLTIRPGVGIKIGRKVNAKTSPDPNNGYFDAKVLSRTHAELTFDKNTVWIQDLKSSNGTFVNGERLSEEGVLSTLRALKTGDSLDFGVDIKDDEGKKLYSKVSTLVTIDYEPIPQNNESMAGARDVEELMALISDEKTLSAEANEALDRIRESFNFLESNLENNPAVSAERPADFDLKLSELDEKIVNLSKTVEFNNSEIKSMINTKAAAETKTKDTDAADIGGLEKSISDAMLKLTNLEKTSERQLVKLEERMLDNLSLVETKLDARLHEIENSSTQLKETILMDKSEYSRLVEKMDTLSTQLETEMKYSKGLHDEIQDLRKTLKSYETKQLESNVKNIVDEVSTGPKVRTKSSKVTAVKGTSTTAVVFVFAIAICVGLGSAYLLSPDGMDAFWKSILNQSN